MDRLRDKLLCIGEGSIGCYNLHLTNRLSVYYNKTHSRFAEFSIRKEEVQIMFAQLPNTRNFHRLLETTEALIQERGCQQTTLQEIMNRSSLSKGAIYHYVRSKDELFGIILQVRMEGVNKQFVRAKNEKDAGLEEPLGAITKGMSYLTDPNDVSNLIFTYLLGRKEEAFISQILSNMYEYSKQTVISWIEAGRQAGVIPSAINAEQTAVMLMTFSYGLRVRTMIGPEEHPVTEEEIYHFMHQALRHPC